MAELSALAARVPTTLSGMTPACARLPEGGALAGRLRPARPAAASRGGRCATKALNLRVRRLPAPDLGDRGHRAARPQAAADRMKFLAAYLMATHSNGISRAAAAKAARPRLPTTKRLAAVRQAAPRHGRPQPRPCCPGWSRSTRPRSSARSRRRSARRWRAQPSGRRCPVAGAVEVQAGGPGPPHPADRHQGLCRSQDPCTRRHLAPTSPPGAHPSRPMAGPGYPQALPAPSITSPTSSARWLRTSSYPGTPHPSVLEPQRLWALGVSTSMACAPQAPLQALPRPESHLPLQPPAEPPTPPLRSLLGIGLAPHPRPPTTCFDRTGELVHKPPRRYRILGATFVGLYVSLNII